ncbi:MAG: hypothetical protein HYR85_13285 [Planctomycetes bacterium]|nr:hypothetical protein [Planctomycetota bacterium]MBI3844942.1 hypothetical protein [Planctomycetota bacterium]
MTRSYLEVTYRKGRAIAAYYTLPRREGDRVVRSESAARELVVDYANDGRAIGIEIVSPTRFDLSEMNQVLIGLGHQLVASDDMAPLPIAARPPDCPRERRDDDGPLSDVTPKR